MRHSLKSMNSQKSFKIYDSLKPQNNMIFASKANLETQLIELIGHLALDYYTKNLSIKFLTNQVHR